MIGIDMEDVCRFSKMEERERSKFLTEKELEYCKERSAATVAGFWCAKEAVVKAMGSGFGEIGYLDVVICHDERRMPYAVVPKVNLTFEVSISHTEKSCVAVALSK